jgi:tetratricopeptide (TPR) repeat protein
MSSDDSSKPAPQAPRSNDAQGATPAAELRQDATQDVPLEDLGAPVSPPRPPTPLPAARALDKGAVAPPASERSAGAKPWTAPKPGASAVRSPAAAPAPRAPLPNALPARPASAAAPPRAPSSAGAIPSPGSAPRTEERPATSAPDDPFSRDVLAFVRACEAELATNPDALRAARLHFEIARLSETPLGDLRRAGAHYQEALSRSPDHVPAIRGARRVLIARKSYQGALALFDSEARVTSDPHKKASLLYAKGRLLEDVMGLKGEARDAYAAALELDRGDPSLLKALEQCEAASDSWPALGRTYERTANAVAGDPKHRAALVVERARLVEQRLGEPEAAIELYETALRLDPLATGALSALKRLHHAQKRWRDLIGVLTREAEQTKDRTVRAMALYRVGRLHAERLGNRQEALAALERAAAEVPDDLLVLEELARLYEAAERWDALVVVLARIARATETPGDRLTLLHRLGTLTEERLKAEPDAIQFHEQALAIEPTYVPALQALGKLYTRHASWEALVRMHLAEADAVDDPKRRAAAHARVAEILETHLDRIDDAAEHHARALGLVPGYPASFKAITRIYGLLGKHRELVEVYERAVDGAPDPERAITYLFKIGAIFEDALGELPQAAHAYRRVLSLDANHLGAIHALQRATERAGRWQELVEALEIEAEKTKDTAQIVALLHRAGEVLDDTVGDREAALVRFRKVLAIDPKYVPALTSLGRVYYRTGRWEDLLDMYRRELEVTPRGTAAVSLLLKMGELCEERIGRDDEALAHYRRAVDIEPASGPALRALARKHRERGEWAPLVKVLEAELSGLGDPSRRALATYRIGEVYEERLGQNERAISMYEQALKIAPEYRPAVDALTRLRAESKSWAKLVDELARETATAKDPVLAITALVREGEVWADQLREPRRAIACFEAVLEREPSHLAALLALEPLYRKAGAWDALGRTYATEARVLTDPGARTMALRELARLQETRALGTLEELCATYEAVLQLSPGDPCALSTLERIALEGSDARLLTLVDARLAAASDDSAAVAAHQTRMAESLEALGDPGALGAYRAALALDPESLGATRGLSRIAERTGDPAALAEAARREASVSRNGEVAARLLLRSAQVRLERLGDTAGALEDLGRALELHPDSVDAADQLSRALTAAGDPVRLVDQLSRAATSAQTAERQAALWMEVARINSDVQNNLAGAIGALNRVLRSSPSHVPTLVRLAELCTRDSQWTEAANLLGRVVQLAPERDVLRDAHLELATLWEERLGETQRALVSLQAVLALDATSREGLRRLAELYAREGELDKSSDTARKLLGASTDLRDRAAALVLIAKLDRRRGDARGAADALHEAVCLEGPSGSAAAELKTHLAESGGWERYAIALATYIASGGASQASSSARAQAFLELAHVQDDELGLREDGIATLRSGIALLGDEPALREELARRLRRSGRTDEALRELARLLVADVGRADTYRDLARTYDAMHRPDEARYALQPLVVLGAAQPAELATLKERPPRPGQARAGSYDAESLKAIEAGARHESALGLLAALPEAMGKLYPIDLEGYGLSARDRIAPRSGHALRALCDRLATVFGVAEYDLYVHRARGRGVSVELSDPVSVLVPAGLGEVPEAQQVFALGRVFANVARGIATLDKLTPREVEIVLASAARQVAPGFGHGLTSEDFLDDQSKRIAKALSRRNRKTMEELAAQYVNAQPPDFPTWARALQQTANRAALLVGDELSAGVDMLRRTERDLLALDGPTLARTSPVIADLLRFWVSEAAFAFRRRAGTIAPLTPPGHAG